MDKGLSKKQAFLRNGYFEDEGVRQSQSMWFLK